MKITKDMIIADILTLDRGTIPILMQNGLHCMGCAMATGESLEQACMVHDIDCESLLDELNSYMELLDLPQADI